LQLGHEVSTTDRECVPRLVESLAGKKVIGATAGGAHSAAWTKDGEVFTFGCGTELFGGRGLGHGEDQAERIPRAIASAPWDA